MSWSWDSVVTGGYFVGSNNLLQENRFVAKDADDADSGLDYGVVKVIKLTSSRENAYYLLASPQHKFHPVQKTYEMSAM